MFGLAVVCYLFLGGLSGGLCVVAAVSGLSVPVSQLREGPASEQRRLMTVSLMACSGGFVLSGLLLLGDAGNISAVKHLFLLSNPSYLVLGAWSLVIGTILSLVLAILWRAPSSIWSVGLVRALLVAECLVGVAVVLYTGLFLAGMFAVPLWDTAWLVSLFAASSASCALAAFAALANALGLSAPFAFWLRRIVQADLLVVVLEAACSVGFLAAAFRFDPASSAASAACASAFKLLTGEFALAWWGGFVCLGMIAPLVLEVLILRGRRPLPPYSLQALAPALCASAGSLALRYCVVMAGVHPALGF